MLSTLVSGNVEIKKEPMVQSSETLDMFDNQDILNLCNIIPNEVLGLPSGGKEVQHSNLLISILLLNVKSHYLRRSLNQIFLLSISV